MKLNALVILSVLTFIPVFTLTLKLDAQTLPVKTSSIMAEAEAAILRNEYSGINSILISKDGAPVYEHYFNGFTADSLNDSRSSFKSVASLLLGIAIDRGIVKNVNQFVYTFFPEEKAFAADPLKRRMTIKNLLEMRSGIDCDEWNGEKDCESEMEPTNDWLKFSLSVPMKHEPGKIWSYTSIDPMIISGIISNASGMSIMEFAKLYLFEPMGITNYRWTTDPAGHGMTGGSFFIRTQDMQKIGQLLLNRGIWNGKRIVSAKWLKSSTTANIPIPETSFIKLSKNKTAIPQPAFYGYYWYNEQVKTDGFTANIVFASGNGGQYIMTIKDLGLVIVFTQSNYGSWKAKRAFDILVKYIIPAYQ
ncbi:serine hydrolase domain-containing protein [Pedobacter antarcticus]|uniref:serine hydrolase domain-containing protein n=1 Tax=Pedobacter antarcticus TaxID=34086 RepID=UPI000883EC61|nr:serine hydrolase [Pedobacter antarcticus]SDL83137.1 CubicO group peptidase, beta-lactamase class C family [Pedobacter antarcticus]